MAIAQGEGKVEQTRGSRTGQAKDKSGKEYLVEHVLIQNMNKRNVPVKKLFVFHEKNMAFQRFTSMFNSFLEETRSTTAVDLQRLKVKE